MQVKELECTTFGTYQCTHFAINDGHGGRLAVEYAQNHLEKRCILICFLIRFITL
jgi:hypothetical protein